MTCSNLLVWFAMRNQNPTKLRTIHWHVGNVDHELKCLEELGFLNRWFDFISQDQMFSLKNWNSYQRRKAA